MADNIQLNQGSGGDVFAADDISSVKYARTKITLGADGVNDGDVSASNPMPVDNANGTIDAVNSTTTPLSGSATYTGTWTDISEYASISVIAAADVAGTLYYDFSTNASTNDRAVQLSDGTSGALGIHSLIPVAKYGRVRVVNGGSAQSSMTVQTVLCKSARFSMPTSRLGQTLGDYSDILNARAALVGKTVGGNYWTPVSATGNGYLETRISSPATAFGEVSTAAPVPTAQVDFVYGINTNATISSTTGSGTVTAANALLTVDTTAAGSSSAQLTTRRYLNYRPGQGAMARFTAMFTSGAADSKQYAGPGTSSMNNGFFFGYNGTSFGICHINNGSETWIPQASWNADVCDGTSSANNKSGINLDPTKINVFQIKYQYLGAGNIFFFVENSINGQFALVHIIRFAGANTTTSVSQPNMQMLWRAANTANTTSIKVRAASGGLFVEGIRRMLGPKYGRDNTKTTITTETNILSIRNATTFNGVTNRSQIHLRSVSIAANKSGSIVGTAILRIIRNTTLGGSPAFAANDGTTADSGVTITNGQSIASYDTAGTTITGGTVVFNSAVVVGGNSHFDMTDNDIFLGPADTLTFSFQSNDSCTCTVAVSWSEDL